MKHAATGSCGSILFMSIILSVMPGNFLPEARAQQPRLHKKRVIRTESGEILWNKHLPVYIHLSSSPQEDAPTYRMRSDTTPRSADPYYFDTEGINFIRTRWATEKEGQRTIYPRREVLWEVFADGLPPRSKLSFDRAADYQNQGVLHFKEPTRVQIDARDAISGADSSFVSIDGAPFSPFQAPVEVREEGAHEIRFYSVDRVGNAEDVRYQRIVIDRSGPELNWQFEGPHVDTVVSGQSRIILEAEDRLSPPVRITYRLDGRSQQAYRVPLSGAAMSPGRHRLDMVARDAVGQTTRKQLSFFVDKTPPEVATDLMGDAFEVNGRRYATGRNRLKITAFDNKAGVEAIYYRINGQSYMRYERPVSFSGNQDGAVSIQVYAVDRVGNRSDRGGQADADRSVQYIDLTGPALSYELQGPSRRLGKRMHIGPKTRIVLRGRDAESGMGRVEYRVGSRPRQNYQRPFVVSEAGVQQLIWTGYDAVENSNQDSLLLVVDRKGPVIEVRAGIAPLRREEQGGARIPVYPAGTVFFISAEDQRTGFGSMQYRFDNQRFRPATEAPLPAPASRGRHILRIRARDVLGNVSEYQFPFILTALDLSKSRFSGYSSFC